MTAARPRPAFYALALRRLARLRHAPPPAVHALASLVRRGRRGARATDGLGAARLDDARVRARHGRRRPRPRRDERTAAADAHPAVDPCRRSPLLSISAAAAIGIAVAVSRTLWLLVFVAVGAFLVVAYNLELFGGTFHGGLWFPAAWGAFPVLTAYFASARTLHWVAFDIIAEMASGDARSAINALELAVLSTSKNLEGKIIINKDTAQQCMQKSVVNYDKAGDNHYDITSAFIKSLRGSDIDAALYWFGRMIVGGEDPRFVVRRLIVHASEDVGIADPNAMLIAHAAWNALECIGMPEARIPIAQAIIYIAKAPKSNSVILAVDKAFEAAKKKQYRVPIHLRGTNYVGAKQLGS